MYVISAIMLQCLKTIQNTKFIYCTKIKQHVQTIKVKFKTTKHRQQRFGNIKPYLYLKTNLLFTIKYIILTKQ